MRRLRRDDIAFGKVVEIVVNGVRFQVSLVRTGIISHEF
jgi:hypothetical protein